MTPAANLERRPAADAAICTTAAEALDLAGRELARAAGLLELLEIDPAVLSQVVGARTVVAFARLALEATAELDAARAKDASPAAALELLELARRGMHSERLRR